MSSLSQNDLQVLSRILNPEKYFIGEDENSKQSNSNQNKSYSPIKQIELEAIRLAEEADNSLERNEKLIKALETINQGFSVIEQSESEQMASLLNNKAQILRLFKTRDFEARECLDRAIQICESCNPKSVTLKQALAQRGWLNFRTRNEEAAFKDFEWAAQLGCAESRRMAVRCNPYAAMCNQMLMEVMNSKFYSQ